MHYLPRRQRPSQDFNSADHQGQHAGYLYTELKDFKSGRAQERHHASRRSPIWRRPTCWRSPNISRQSRGRERATNQAMPTRRRASVIATSGMCTQCHLSGFLGAGTIPRTGGQTETYLHKTLLDFKTRARANNPDKSTLLASYPTKTSPPWPAISRGSNTSRREPYVIPIPVKCGTRHLSPSPRSCGGEGGAKRRMRAASEASGGTACKLHLPPPGRRRVKEKVLSTSPPRACGDDPLPNHPPSPGMESERNRRAVARRPSSALRAPSPARRCAGKGGKMHHLPHEGVWAFAG